jgi:hypothetical protein
MKFKFNILTLSLIFSIYSFSQEKGTNPTDLAIDIYDYNLSELGVKKIIQYSIVSYTDKNDSIKSKNIHLSYVLNYDTLGRISTFKYDFQEKLDLKTILLETKDITISIDTSNLYRFTKNDTFQLYDYYEKLYSYKNRELKSIIILPPIRFIFDGVYIKEWNFENECIINKINEFDKIIIKETYHNDILYSTLEYEYSEFKNQSYTTNLLTKTTLTSGNSITETIIEYSF